MTRAPAGRQPLAGVKVVDFSTLLPGPMATLMLLEAGAQVLKIERPPIGDELRAATPRWDHSSLGFALLNRGKRSVSLDLKSPADRERLLPLLREADVLVEQFRPGAMDRLGLGYESLRAINPRLVYCSLTGYGQDGPASMVAGHDLTYMAQAGLLSLTRGADGAPAIPPVLVADIGAGSLPAVINILLALRQRDLTGEGCRLDVSITDNLFCFPYWAVARGMACGEWPRPGQERLTGGSPRYQIYRTRDARYIAAAPLEQRFWEVFCEAIGLPGELRHDARDPQATRAAVASIIEGEESAHWRAVFAGKDACAVVVNTMEEAAADPHFVARRLFARSVQGDAREAPAIPLPLDRQFVADGAAMASPALGEANALLGEADGLRGESRH